MANYFAQCDRHFEFVHTDVHALVVVSIRITVRLGSTLGMIRPSNGQTVKRSLVPSIRPENPTLSITTPWSVRLRAPREFQGRRRCEQMGVGGVSMKKQCIDRLPLGQRN